MSRASSFQPIQIAGFIIVALLLTCAAVAQNYVAPSTPVVGSPQTVTANAPVPRPTTTPCTVTLFQNYDFANYSPQYFNYTPPSGCPGPWAAVVFEADWSVDAGVQYDRTTNIWIGGSVIFFGTTAEPSSNFVRRWHTESNLTELSPLFTIPQAGMVDLFNIIESGLTSHYHGSAYLQFYPLEHGQNPPPAANVVLPMSAGPTGGTVALNTPSDQLTGTFTLPTNVERAYLDVFAQGQQEDEFWYTCAPNNIASELFSCPSTAFREAEVSIDGTPAGVAPIYPWIFTGGIDPFLWQPIPGVHTLNFEPYRVDLTPFAGVLSNGQQHTVAVSVYNADQYFSATANLLLYQDLGSRQVTGRVTTNTIGQPDPMVRAHITDNGTYAYGTISDTSNRGFTVEGYVETSHGNVDTKVVQSIDFDNGQLYYVKEDGTIDDQDVFQTTNISSSTTTRAGGNVTTNSTQFSWPLTLFYAFTFNADGSYEQNTEIQQGFTKNVLVRLNGHTTYSSSFSDDVTPTDDLYVDSSGNAHTSHQTNSETYQYSNSDGACWNETLRAAAGVLTSQHGGSCGR
ncbi:MAG: peptide-N4-asparagine amidase [Candidatus Korobacteraceae bacterium]|jgi:peptide N-acetyl-beta-D-glucosaminyl asparaginase amidase A